MSKSIKLVSAIIFLAGLSGCSSNLSENTLSEARPSAHITHAPAIDVSHSEMTQDIEENIGLNVRWGGQVIASEKRDEFTLLTVFANPVSNSGKPQSHADPSFGSGRGH